MPQKYTLEILFVSDGDRLHYYSEPFLFSDLEKTYQTILRSVNRDADSIVWAIMQLYSN